MSVFSRGDRVVVDNHLLASHEETGIVRSVLDGGDYIVVDLDNDHTGRYRASSLRRQEYSCNDIDADISTNKKPSLVYVYYHDNPENPKSLVEAVERFSLEEVNLVSLSLDSVMNDIENHIPGAYDNCFLIIDGVLHVVEFDVKLRVLD